MEDSDMETSSTLTSIFMECGAANDYIFICIHVFIGGPQINYQSTGMIRMSLYACNRCQRAN